MNQIGCVALTLLGIILLVSPNLLISKDTQNTYLKNIYKNNKMFGSSLLVGAFYLYTIEYNQIQKLKSSVPLSNISVPLSNAISNLSVPLSSSSSSPLSSELISNLS